MEGLTDRAPQQGDLVEVEWLGEGWRPTWHILEKSEEDVDPAWPGVDLYHDQLGGNFLSATGQVYSFDQCPVSGADLVVGHAKLILPAYDSMAEVWDALLPLTIYFGGNGDDGDTDYRGIAIAAGLIRVFRPDIARYGDPSIRLLAELCTDDPTELIEAHNKLSALRDYLANVRAKEQK